ncbi:hypothetical protein [Streptomyces sp. NPDC050504]|uniref:hypothetical protein n=1 Tax=Streptomyces sp. NPDC050504 TaxID=3365618 RepID=UPI00378BA16C
MREAGEEGRAEGETDCPGNGGGSAPGGESTDTCPELAAALDGHALVNLTGPPGIGKTWLAERATARAPGRGSPLEGALLIDLARPDAAQRLRAYADGDEPGPLVLDSVDGPGRAERARRALDGLRRQPHRTLLISRRPLRAQCAWADTAMADVAVAPSTERAVLDRAAALGVTSPEEQALVGLLSGGVPLLAAAACRALHHGVPAAAPGAVADRVATEILTRLERELPGRQSLYVLRRLATVGSGDEHLLGTGPGLFTSLADLSVVGCGPLGLTVLEPYRTVIELAYQWRKPVAHRSAQDRAARYRRELLVREQHPGGRADLVEQGLFLSGDPMLRATLFPTADTPARIAPANLGDADDIGRLMHAWTLTNGFDRRRSERLTETWLDTGISGFHVARDREGTPVGLTYLAPMGENAAQCVEPLLQQHAEPVSAATGPGALFLGAAYSADRGTHARILRHILKNATSREHLVVSTTSGDYQQLMGRLRFSEHGATRDDVYRCGRRPRVYSHDFRAASLPGWLAGLGGPDQGAPPGAVPQVDMLVARALGRIGNLGALADNPLVGLPGIPDARTLQDRLHEAVRELAGSEERADAEAGAILRAYYFRPGCTHHQVARDLHLSRATYFRRLSRGHAALGALLLQRRPTA